MLSNTQMPSIKTVISAAASAAATAMVIRSVAKDLIPREFQGYFFQKIRGFLSSFSNERTMIIEEYDGLYPNHLFQSAEVYLATVITPDTKRLRVTKPEKEKQIKVWMEKNEELNDLFCGFQIKWRLVCQQVKGKYVAGPEDYYGGSIRQTEVRFFELVFHKKIKDKVIGEYLPYILEKSKILKEENKTLKLWTLKNERGGPRRNPWQSVNLDHPATFDTLAMESDAKETVMADLQRAAAATAMATVRVMDPFRHNQGSSGVTLSGLLNFIDGLWSSCGDERIIVFTTNHKEKLDPALLRPGRMDMHIHMSYCTPCGFKMLAKNYLGISEHPLFSEIELLIEMKKVTPAEIGEQLMKNEEAEIALRGLLEFLEEKKESEEVKDGEIAEENESGSGSAIEDKKEDLVPVKKN
ncbi:hypothetical protein Vadar_008489 [Vaccinium darrowii]|uniref:Uncharacterized protein n=1 Tax=Vaccinium darrowii TaxID=229202 RepID=A0ACB7YCB6_9ERIC|nr:hypothetical protein Vadar_008489 [Vaccinium darrowii]